MRSGHTNPAEVRFDATTMKIMFIKFSNRCRSPTIQYAMDKNKSGYICSKGSSAACCVTEYEKSVSLRRDAI